MSTHKPESRFQEPRFLESEAYMARAPRRMMEVLGPFVIRRIGGTELYRKKRDRLQRFGPRVFDAMTFLRVMVPGKDEIEESSRAAEHWDTFFYDLGNDAKEHTKRIIDFRNEGWIHPNSYDDKQVYDCLVDILELLLAVHRAQEADPAMRDLRRENETGIERVRAMLSVLGGLLAVGDAPDLFSGQQSNAPVGPSGMVSKDLGAGQDVGESNRADSGIKLSFSASLESSPEYRRGKADAMVEQARLAVEEGAFDVAIANYGAVGTFYREGQYDAEHAAAFHRRGRSHARSRKYAQAMADFDAARLVSPSLELEAEDAGPYHNTANEKLLSGEWAEAIELFTLVLSLNAEGSASYPVERYTRRGIGITGGSSGRFSPLRMWEIYHDRGRARLEIGDYESALADFNESAFRSGTPNPVNELMRGIAQCCLAVQSRPLDASVYVDRARAYNDSQDYERAVADLTRAQELDASVDCARDYRDVHLNRAYSYFDCGQMIQDLEDDSSVGWDYFGKAADECTLALNIDPSNASVLWARGETHFSMEQYERAVQDFVTALDIAPDKSGSYCDAWGEAYNFDAGECLFDKARALAAMGDYSQAIEDLRRIMSGDRLTG